MSQIQLLSQDTIDKIAAGEVVERPASIVKELVENAIDAGANAVTVEIKEGGTSFIRITDNGEGIAKEEVPKAFLRHATSKIRRVEDLLSIGSLGFRGEALSSIAAVCQVELITKTAGSLTGTRYLIEGGLEKGMEEIGAPEGSTFLVRNIFYNTPARKKFLKSSATEAGYVSDLMEHLALSHPEISFKFINNGQTKLHTSGNCNLKDIIYSIYGRDIAANLMEIHTDQPGVKITGYIGKPLISRGNRNFENYFINGRYVKSTIIAKAIEEGYKTFMMQHRYPFTVLCFSMDGDMLDVNVHPTKMELRFSDNARIYQMVYETVKAALTHRELIPQVSVSSSKEEVKAEEESVKAKESAQKKVSYPEPFEKIRRDLLAESKSPYQPKYPQKVIKPSASVMKSSDRTVPDLRQTAAVSPISQTAVTQETPQQEPAKQTMSQPKFEQQTLFEEKLLSRKSVPEHRLIGQLFDTYWLIQFRDNLYIIDQHAAHEKVMYERLTTSLKTKEFTSQQISPPMILTLSMQEEELLKKYMDIFRQVGFEIEPFGGREYSICAVPDNLFGFTEKSLFIDMLDSLSDTTGKPSADFLNEKLATMACKSAVKGNNRLSVSEANALIQELLGLENPYNCPHGRPTIISMSKYELEKKFKRIV